ncbi:MAG: phage terminase large subunit [Oscillospiraceae bacterium]|nr:phage terminase large subunit [Oscillospiraceae bacterium]
MKHNVIWSPQPRQALFMARPEYEALYGGAAGGGKSDALVMEALRQVHIPHYKALILRKTFPQLAELQDKAEGYYPRAFPGAKFNASTHTWRFPSGARVVFGAMQHPGDRVKYQGQAFDLIAFDELTHFTWEEYAYMFSRNRPNGPGTRVYIRATANPGGVGHGWVKSRFLNPAPPMTTIRQPVSWTRPDGVTEQRQQSRIFVPSSVFDNPALLENDPMYVQRLASMPEAEKRALLYGDWNSFSGQVFTEWVNDPNHYADRVGSHVIAPFAVPEHWGIWCSMDWGFSKPFSVGWYAVDTDRRLYRIRELYGCTGTPDRGVRWEPGRLAREILQVEGSDPNLRGRHIRRVGDPAIWGSDGTESIGAIMERSRVWFEKGRNSRLDGKMQVHHRLAFDPSGRPGLYVFDTCRHFIRTVPDLVYDSVNVEDVDTAQEDHIYDELRYVCMENPVAPPVSLPRGAQTWDPLGRESREDGYGFFRKY